MKAVKTAALAALFGATALTAPAMADTVKVGLAGGISGPIAAMAPPMISAANLAFEQVNAAGGVLGGKKIEGVVGDSGCNEQTGIDSTSKLVNIDGVVAMVGPHCSGAVLGSAKTATIPSGVALVTPSGTSPAITGLKDGDTVFRTVPSDDYQGRALARTLVAQGTKKLAVTYLNNDYGKGLAEAFKDEYMAQGGEVAGYGAHEEGKASYRAELATLAGQGADTLVIFDYGDGAGLTILRQALENGFFTNFVGGDGMKSQAPIDALGADNLGTFTASAPVGEASASLETFNTAYAAAGGNKDDIFVSNSYDAGFLVALAIEQAGSTDRKAIAAALRDVASAPGVEIMAGEWAKAKAAIAAGKGVNYKGAAGDHEFDANGDVPGTYAMFRVQGNAFVPFTEMK